MRVLAATLLFAAIASPAHAQLEPPAGLTTVEERRSRSCVETLERVRVLDEELTPFGIASARLQQIAQAVTLEDGAVLGSLDASDPMEGAVAEWYVADQFLAQRFAETGADEVAQERASSKQAVRETISAAAVELQGQVDSVLSANEETILAAGPCDGAIFVRPAVLEACGDLESELCDAARASAGSAPTPFRFVDDAVSMWDVEQLRPWTAPTRLQVGPTGQLDGARTVGYTRVGNVVVTTAISPILRESTEVTPSDRFQFEQTNQALGLIFSHPTITFTPGFGMRAALPEALAGEDEYILHFGDPSAPDVVWRGDADTGQALEATVPMEASHVLRLRNGDALSLTAVREDDPQYTIMLDTTGQIAATEALVTYMSAQLSADLNELIPPTG